MTAAEAIRRAREKNAAQFAKQANIVFAPGALERVRARMDVTTNRARRRNEAIRQAEAAGDTLRAARVANIPIEAWENPNFAPSIAGSSQRHAFNATSVRIPEATPAVSRGAVSVGSGPQRYCMTGAEIGELMQIALTQLGVI